MCVVFPFPVVLLVTVNISQVFVFRGLGLLQHNPMSVCSEVKPHCVQWSKTSAQSIAVVQNGWHHMLS